MKRFFVTALTLSLCLIIAVGFFARPALAQDEMMTHVCDSTLISLLYIAEYNYGFHSMMDVSTFEKGQYAPLFDAMMAEMMEGEEAMEEEMMATEEAMMEGEEMMEDMVVLTPGNIEGEDETCTALRVELDAFLYTALTTEMMMMESEG